MLFPAEVSIFLIYFVTSHDEYAKSRCGTGFETGKLYLKEIVNGVNRLPLTTHSEQAPGILNPASRWLFIGVQRQHCFFLLANKHTANNQRPSRFNAIQL